ncbi:M1 family metallopeptidase [Chloroflexota bacterium]
MITKSAKIIVLVSLYLLVTLACNPSSANVPAPPAEQSPIEATASQPNTPTPTLAPSSTPSPFPTPTPTESPLPVPTEIIPVLELDNLDLHRQAMLPDFADDVDAVAKAGASRYYLEVELEPDSLDGEGGVKLSGRERVQYTNTENETLSEIYFRLYPNLPAYGGQMTVEVVTIDGQLVEPALEAEDSALRVPLSQLLASGEVIDISLTYTILVPVETLFGYNILIYEDDTVTLSGFYPTIAMYDEEGWDVKVPPYYGDAPYLDVALYQVQLTVPEEMVVAASGSLLDSASNDDGTKTLSLVSGPIREFYIAMREDYEVTSETIDGVTVNSYYPPRIENGGKAALRYAVDSLRVFNERFGPYPYAEFDVVATPTTAGGIEYPGIVVVNQQLYEFEGAFFQQAVVHEVIHQWWYGVVGNNQIDEPWLDEALTSYSTIFYWEDVAGAKMAGKIIESYFLNPYEKATENGEDRAVVGPVGDFSEREYSIFVYGKGPLFFNALRQKVGNDVYLEIMQTYYTKYKYKMADGDDLLTLVERISGQDVDPLFEKWMQ